MIIDHSKFQLGKRAARANFNVLRLSQYTRQLPPPPSVCYWSAKLNHIGMMRNDIYGDCTCACLGHAIQTWTAWTSSEFTPPDRDILAAYSAITGFEPNRRETDRGAVLDDVLNWWLANPITGHLLSARTAIGVGDLVTIKQGIYILGGLSIGVRLPISAQRQEVWDVPAGGTHGQGAPGSWGGHCVWAVDYDDVGPYFVTWGMIKRATWNFWRHYVDEAHGLLSKDWLDSNQTPTGLNWDQVSIDLKRLAT